MLTILLFYGGINHTKILPNLLWKKKRCSICFEKKNSEKWEIL